MRLCRTAGESTWLSEYNRWLWANCGAVSPSRMSGNCLFWTSVWTLFGKSVQSTVWTLTVMAGLALWNAAAMASQNVLVLLAGPVP
jgi:hypothetical protein